MRPILWCAATAFNLAAGLLVLACSSGGFFEDYTKPVYIGGTCGGDDSDCHTEFNNIPGSFCHQNECVCPEGMDKCCPGGEWDENGNPLNCKVDGDYRCRTWDECHPPEPNPEPEPECTTAADCPRPSDLRCGEATCKAGKCGIDIFFPSGKIAWQSPGDCKTAYCDSFGNVVLQEDPSDRPVTANPCIADSCSGSQPVNTSLGEGEACIEATGVCDTVETTSGPVIQCVECIWPNDSTCPSGRVCAGPGLNFCVPGHCLNHIQDEDETSVDCGGVSCAPCGIGVSCFQGSDCMEGICKDSVCVPPTHDDGVKNDGETGTDCGCLKCLKRCSDGDGCVSPSHCTSGVCYGGLCQAPTCFDMVQNGSEQGVDCGEGCELSCPVQSSSG